MAIVAKSVDAIMLLRMVWIANTPFFIGSYITFNDSNNTLGLR